MRNRKINRKNGVLLALLLCFVQLVFLPVSVLAEGRAGGTGGAIQIEAGYAGMQFYLYRVAEATDTGYILRDTFRDSAVSLDVQKAEEWRRLAQILESYIQKQNVPADGQMTTKADGNCTFAALPDGLYLCRADELEQDTTIVQTAPSLIAITAADTEPVQIEPKTEIRQKPEQPTKPEKPTTPEQPTNPENPTNPKQPTKPDTSDKNTVKKTTSQTTPTKLPQTGQLWWPVYALSIAGIALILCGLYSGRKTKKEGTKHHVHKS